MGKPRLLITRPLPDAVFAAAQAICDVTMRAENTPLTAKDVAVNLSKFDVLLPTLGDDISAAAFQSTPDPTCKLIANFGVGYNHIDVARARNSGIVVTNTPGAVTDATADIAILLMLMVARRAGEGERMVRDGRWSGWHPTQLLGSHIGGKTLGIIGMGRIGRAVAQRAHDGFGMKIVFFNRSLIDDCEIADARQIGSLTDLMAECDFVSVNTPGGAGTRHLMSARVLAAARPGLILVNTARGDVVDQAALIQALSTGVIAGAGLDVYEHEPIVPPALRAMNNVVLLPHLGTNALDVRTEMGLMAVENIRAFFAGHTPPNRVDNV